MFSWTYSSKRNNVATFTCPWVLSIQPPSHHITVYTFTYTYMHPSIYLSPIHLSSIKPSTHTSTHLPSIRLHIHPHPAYPLILPLCIYASLTHSRIHLPHPSLAHQPTPPPTPPSLIHLPIHPFVHLPIYLYISSEPPDGLFQTCCF